jgi:type II secretory pathway component GspD/PulD (secretin)
MKKFTFILMTLALLALPAAAQEPPPGEGGPPVPPDMGDPGGPPPEVVAAAAAAAAEQAAPPEVEAPPAEVKTNAAPVTIEAGTARTAPRAEVSAPFAPPAQPVGTNNADGIVMNFKNAPLEMVLNYLSDAAGFIIVLDTRVNGNVSIINSHPMTRDEAVDLLNSVLNKNGYAVIRSGRTLTIVDKNDAKTRSIPVKSGNKPEEIPNNAEIVTQIIPIRFVEARQLVSDLTSFVTPQATVVANEAGNAIIITDTQANIRHLAEIIRAIDNSAEAETEIRVFRLKHASPADVAATLAGVFPSSGSGGSTQSPVRFGGGGDGPGSFFRRMMGGSGSSSGSNDRVKKATAVTAVADARIQAVIVTAPKDLMEQIAVMMTDLDVSSTRDQKVYVFKMNNGDPQQAVQVLQNMFQSGGASRSGSGSSANSALMQRAQNNATQAGSTSTGTSGFGSGTGNTGGRSGGQF